MVAIGLVAMGEDGVALMLLMVVLVLLLVLLLMLLMVAVASGGAAVVVSEGFAVGADIVELGGCGARGRRFYRRALFHPKKIL